MTVCHACSITLDPEYLAYFGPEGARWRVRIASILAIGEYRSEREEAGHFLAIVTDASGTWFQAPGYAIGIDSVLADLGRRFATDLSLSLNFEAAPSSRILWPQPLAGETLFEPAVASSEAASCSGFVLHRRLMGLIKWRSPEGDTP